MSLSNCDTVFGQFDSTKTLVIVRADTTSGKGLEFTNHLIGLPSWKQFPAASVRLNDRERTKVIGYFRNGRRLLKI